MIAFMVVVIDERLNLVFQLTREVVVLQQDSILQGSMPSFDLALGLGMVRLASGVRHAVIFQVSG